MSIKYKMYPITDTINEQPVEGLIARPISRGTIGIDRLAQDVAEGTTFNKAEIKAITEILVMQIEKNLKAGYTVNLGELGSFFVSATGKKVRHEDEIRGYSVKLKRITYRPSRALTKRMKGTPFTRE